MNNNFIILTVTLAILGFLTGRLSYKLGKKKEKESVFPFNYFKGIDFLLNNQEDKALQEFINAAKISSRNAEIYLTLGNIYRNKGEYERAIRIHQSILVQEDIEHEVRARALLNLAKDFKKAGFYTRAINVLNQLEQFDKKNINAIFEKIDIYILGKKWESAINCYKIINKNLNKLHINNFSSIYAELAKKYIKEKKFLKAKFLLKKAIQINNQNPYIYKILGDYYYKKNNFTKASLYYKRSLDLEPFGILFLKQRIKNFSNNIESYAKNNLLLFSYFKLREYIKNNQLENAEEFIYNKILENEKSDFLRELYLIVIFLKSKNYKVIKLLRKNLHFNFNCCHCKLSFKNFYWQCPNCKNWLTFKNRDI